MTRICRAIGTASFTAERMPFILIGGECPTDKEFSELLLELDEAKAAVLEWQEAEGR